MKFRKRLFTVLTILFTLYVCVGVELANNAAQQTIANAPIDANRSAYNLGVAIGGSTMVFFCYALVFRLC